MTSAPWPGLTSSQALGGVEKHTINVRNASWPSRVGRRQAGHQAPTRDALNLHAADDLLKSYGPRRDEGVAPVDVIRVSPAQLALVLVRVDLDD